MLKIFLALLPYLLSILGRLQGLHSQAAVDFSVINKYYIFQARFFITPDPNPEPSKTRPLIDFSVINPQPSKNELRQSPPHMLPICPLSACRRR